MIIRIDVVDDDARPPIVTNREVVPRPNHAVTEAAETVPVNVLMMAPVPDEACPVFINNP